MKKYLIALLFTTLTIFTAENKENGVVTLKINVQEPATQLKKIIETAKNEIRTRQQLRDQIEHINHDTLLTILEAAGPALDELTQEHETALIIQEWEKLAERFDKLMDKTPLLIKASFFKQSKAQDFFTLLYTSVMPDTYQAQIAKKEIMQELVTQPQLIPKKSSLKPARTSRCVIL